MSDETARKKVMHYLAIGASTADALRCYLGREVRDAQYVRVMTGLELEGEIRRGMWGELPVWRHRKVSSEE
jgi:hypothetical protein